MPTLLVIDDEQNVRYTFQRLFQGDQRDVLAAATAAEGLALFRERRPEVVILDLQLPDRDGLQVFHEIHRLDPKRPVIFITAHGSTDTAIEAMKGGAFDYLIKPVNLERVSQVIDRAFDAVRLMETPAVLPTDERGDRIVGRSAIMQEMSKQIGRVAPQDVNVLILGESGTGKELVARALYQHSRRAARPFLAINCAAIPELLLESELFGHEAAAFTGAQRQRIGKFEQCDGGTLFLDEIGDMPLSLQAKMLRVLQDQRFERVGGNESVQVNVRILAATNQDLQKRTADGGFRKELFYRLNTVTIRIPPLRERRTDIAELATYFLFRFNRELGLDFRGFAPEVLDALQNFSWPGNVRELQSVVKQAMLSGSGNLITPEFLAEHLLHPPPAAQATEGVPVAELAAWIEALAPHTRGRLHAELLAAVERVLFTWALRQTRGHQTHAAELLGINRTTLRYKLRMLGLHAHRPTGEGPETP